MNELDASPTFRLFKIPTVLDGMVMALDASCTQPVFNTDRHPEIADAKAIASDWQAVMQDLSIAMQSAIR